MNDPNDADEAEAAARRIQEQIWMAGNDDDLDGGGANNNAGAVQDFVRQLLDRDNAGGEHDDGGGGDAEEDDLDDDDEAAENRRGSMDGGIAGEVRDDQQIKVTRSLKCPLVLYFECDDDLDELLCPGNPVLKRGTTVYIGLDKNTKLSLVFHQYCRFVNSKIPKRKGSICPDAVKPSDFEFLHCTLLDESLTVEASAMMKNDRIKVCRERSRERAARDEVLRLQRESDRKYFKDLRQLLPKPTPEGTGADVVLDCRGKLTDERGFSQNVLATTVRANSALVGQRCKWLGHKIANARADLIRRARMTVPSDEEKSVSNEGRPEEGEAAASEAVKSSQSDDEEDIIMAEAAVVGEENRNNVAGAGNLVSSVKVEDDDDDDGGYPTDDDTPLNPLGRQAKASRPARMVSESHPRGSSSSSSSANPFPNAVWVALDHSPQAVKLLLEYCYTNRVQSLGLEAFHKSSRVADPKDRQSGPVAPFRKHEWPGGGLPTVSLHLALAGIALAEEARVPRLSLMCEVAASQLVSAANVVDVLGACQLQQRRTGNRLPLLRRAAMLDCVMAHGSSGIDDLYANPNFRSNLDERRGLVIPSLLDGTVEVMPTNMNSKDIRKKKDKKAADRKRLFDQMDKADKAERGRERKKWNRPEVVDRRMEVAYGPFSTPPAKGRAVADPSNIWRDCWGRDPPPPLGGGLGPALGGAGGTRGVKRKGGGRASGDGGGGPGGGRNVRRRQARKQKSSLSHLA